MTNWKDHLLPVITTALLTGAAMYLGIVIHIKGDIQDLRLEYTQAAANFVTTEQLEHQAPYVRDKAKLNDGLRRIEKMNETFLKSQQQLGRVLAIVEQNEKRLDRLEADRYDNGS